VSQSNDPTRRATRREFLQAGAAAGGGLLIGISLTGCGDKPADVAPTPTGKKPPKESRLNAWLSINRNGEITFFSPYSEMGQGVYTSIPALLAEELEVPLWRVSVVDGGANPVYVNDLLGIQVTGGSTAVRAAYTKIRAAGAEARLRLLEAAAQRWQVPVAQLYAKDGAVHRAPGAAGTEAEASLTYADLADAAAEIPAPADIPLKPNDQFSQIGRPLPRVDTPAKTDGTAIFGIDVRRPNQLYGSIIMCPVLGGTVAGLNELAAREMPGVVDVVLVGNGVVVVAEHFWQAIQGRDALDVRWSVDGFDQLDNANIRAGLAEAAQDMTSARTAREDGDVEVALASAERRVDAVYELPMLAHATMEPMNCTAEFIGDELHVWVGTQVQGVAQAVAASAGGVAPEQVKVHTPYLGGGFGRRLDADFIPAAVSAAQKLGRPVQLIWTREDDMTHDNYRPPAHDTATAGFDADGNLIAWKLDLVGPSITARWAPAVVADAIDPFAVEAAANYPYAVPNVQVRFLRHEIGIDVGYWRSVSHATNCFVAESFMDELAHASRNDPYQYRRGLLANQPLWRNVLDLVAAKGNWGRAPDGVYQGVALMEGYNTYMAQVADITVRGGKIRVEKITCALDCGQVINPAGVRAQVQSAVIFGLSAALWGQIDIEDGQVQQRNFDTMRVLRINEIPEIDIHIVDSDRDPGGMGEPATALVAPAIGNAYYQARFERVRSLPFSAHGLA